MSVEATVFTILIESPVIPGLIFFHVQPELNISQPYFSKPHTFIAKGFLTLDFLYSSFAAPAELGRSAGKP